MLRLTSLCVTLTLIMMPHSFFFSFQGVWDKLYLNPMEAKGHLEPLTAYFRALGFT